MPHAEWIKPEAVVQHRTAWADLASRCLEPSIFNDPDFAVPALLHIPGRRRPRVLAVWEDAEPGRLIGLCGLAPFVPGLPSAAWLHPQATAAFPVLDAQRAGAALTHLLQALGGGLRAPGLLMQGLPEHGATLGFLASSRACSVERLEERNRAVLRPDDRSFGGRGGKEMRRQARRLAELGRIGFASARSPDDVGRALDVFLTLESSGWKGRRGTALGQSTRLRIFAEQMTAALAADGRCRIDRLDLDGTPIAMGIVLRIGTTAYFWKTAFDERFARFSPGLQLAERIGDVQTHEPGIEVTDSCAIPGHAMIDRLWPGRTTVVDAVIGPSPVASRVLRLAVQAERARRDLRAWAKRRVRPARTPSAPHS